MGNNLSIFRPYERDAKHEDQLTRAALIVMKLVPLAHEAFLGLGDCQRLSELPRPRFDMQTERLVPLGSEVEDPEVTELVSVFLGPHENLGATQELNLTSERRARYDGVIQYGSRLLLVIESKLYANASEQQSLDINTGALSHKASRLVHVRWQELLDRWWNLTELGVLGHSEEGIMGDFFDNAEGNFGDLLPYSDLGRCGGNEKRLLRRLRMILEQATGLMGETYKGGVASPIGETFPPGAHVIFPDGQVKAIQRVALSIDGSNIRLGASPGEQKSQYEQLYLDPAKVEALIALGEEPGWDLTANFHIAYRNCRPENRWYPPRHLPGPAYARQWMDDVREGNARGRWRPQIDESFRRWLVKRNYADDEDLAALDDWLNKLSPKIQLHIRPAVSVSRRWDLEEAVSRDRAGVFTIDVLQAIDQVLAALGEPKLKDIQQR